MSFTYDYVTFDVFTKTPYSGNPLAIVHLHADGADMTQTQKQKIAKEFNYSETVFIHPEISTAGTKVDIFTRFQEVSFAGHPVIGTAQYLRQCIARKDNHVVNKLRMIIKAGIVDVDFDNTGLAIASVPHHLRTHKESVDIDRILCQHPELASVKSSLPSQCPVISSVKGMTNIIIDVSSAEEALTILRTSKPPQGVVLDLDFSPSPIGSHFFAKLKSHDPALSRYQVRRMMSDGVEDPATGSAAVALAGYLAMNKPKAETRHRYEMVQGTEMGRQSDIFVDVVLTDTADAVSKIFLSGHAVKIMEGKLTVYPN